MPATPAAAVETMEAIRLVKAALPHAKTVLGISNVSFGLPAAAREVVNSVFLYHCTKAGLDLAIVNAEKLERFASIPEAERRMAENLLFNAPPADAELTNACATLRWIGAIKLRNSASPSINSTSPPLPAISGRPARRGPKSWRRSAARPAAGELHYRRNQRRPDRGSGSKLAEGAAPLDIINGPLMAGMSEVGRLFNNNELIVAEVLQSAEAMKAAVDYLEGFLGRREERSSARGQIILATVKGDVHDIGKNLVEIILANNGYEVINLGIKVPPEALIQAYFEHQPDAIGLSGLLVKSTQQMVATASDFKAAGIHVPLLVGGAALSEKFTRTKIASAYGEAAYYAKDAMAGLKLMNQIMDPAERDAVLAQFSADESPVESAVAEAAAPERHHATQRQGSHRSRDSTRSVSRPQSSHGAESRGNMELHQSLHALRAAPGLQGRFRNGLAGTRREGA